MESSHKLWAGNSIYFVFAIQIIYNLDMGSAKNVEHTKVGYNRGKGIIIPGIKIELEPIYC